MEAVRRPLRYRGVEPRDLEVGVGGRRAVALHVDQPWGRATHVHAQRLGQLLRDMARSLLTQEYLEYRGGGRGMVREEYRKGVWTSHGGGTPTSIPRALDSTEIYIKLELSISTSLSTHTHTHTHIYIYIYIYIQI